MLYTVVGRETIAGVAAATGFTAANIPPTQLRTMYALVQALSGPVRVCVDGTTPTATKGLKIGTEESIEVWGGESLENFRAIDDGAVATLEVIYFGRGGS